MAQRVTVTPHQPDAVSPLPKPPLKIDETTRRTASRIGTELRDAVRFHLTVTVSVNSVTSVPECVLIDLSARSTDDVTAPPILPFCCELST